MVLLVRWGWHTLSKYMKLHGSNLPGQEGQATLNFPNKLSSWEWLGPTLILGYELTLLLVLSTRALHAWYRLCSEGDQFCSPASHLEYPKLHCLQELLPDLLVRWGQKILFTVGEDLAPCVGMGKPGSFEGPNQADLHPYPQIPLSECAPN